MMCILHIPNFDTDDRGRFLKYTLDSTVPIHIAKERLGQGLGAILYYKMQILVLLTVANCPSRVRSYAPS